MVSPIPSGEPQTEAMRRARYDVELVLLEIVKAGRVNAKPSQALSTVNP
jgi:hypothetical protein